MNPNSDGSSGEKQRNSGGTQHFEFTESVGVFVGGRTPREFPAKEGNKVSKEVYEMGLV